MKNESTTGAAIFGNKSTRDYMVFAVARWPKIVSWLCFVFPESFSPSEAF